MLDVLDLSFGDTLFQHHEDCTGNPLRIDAVIAPELLLDAGQELLFMAYSQRLASRIPAFVVQGLRRGDEIG